MKIRYIAFAVMLLAVGILAACGGGSTSTTPSGFSQTYTASAGAGEVMQFSVDTTNLTYTYLVIQSSYSTSYVGKTGTGSLSAKTPLGGHFRFNVGASNDSFIQSGVVMLAQNGLLVGHVQISAIGGTAKIPVFGVSNPIQTVALLADTYNFQGFACAGKSGGNVLTGGVVCGSHTGTIYVDSSGNYSTCVGGNIAAASPASVATASPACTSSSTGIISLTSTTGVYDIQKTGGTHTGWFIAFTAPNGQKVAVIDHDDSISTIQMFGHTVATTQTPFVAGAADGNYFTRDNWGGAGIVNVSGTNLTVTPVLGASSSGTLTPDTPWAGMTTYTLGASSGVAMVAGTGAFTDTNAIFPSFFGIGLRY